MTASYWTFRDMWDVLRGLEERHSQFMTVDVIGISRQGRNIPGVTLTNSQTGKPGEKSAIFVDANIHAGEVAGNTAAMYWIEWCLNQYGTNPEATELLDYHTVYVVPRIAIDGAELYLTTPERMRSSPHPYPFSTPPEGFVEEDIDQNGYILMMRVPAEDGGFVPDELNPLVMRPRHPGESGDTYYHLFPEGRIEWKSVPNDFPAFSSAERARRRDMDFNRNFPIRWAGETGQRGAGPFPLSEPELQNLARFIHAHPNIAAYASLHTSGGVILRQPSTGEDSVLSEMDRELFTRVADMGAQVSGYVANSNYRVFATGHEKVLMPGAADDWMYDHFGVLSFTVEIWNLPKRAGARGYAELGVRGLMELKPEDALESVRKIYAWAAAEAPSGVFSWTPYEHPDFGWVEIGGLDFKFIEQNPPHHLLEEECAHVSAFLTRLGLSTPKLIQTALQVTRQTDDLYRIVVEWANAGYLPTSSTAKGKDVMLEGLSARIAGDIEVISGRSPLPIGHLDGYGGQDGSVPPHRQRVHAAWVIRAKAGATVEVMLEGPRAGKMSQTIMLGEG